MDKITKEQRELTAFKNIEATSEMPYLIIVYMGLEDRVNPILKSIRVEFDYYPRLSFKRTSHYILTEESKELIRLHQDYEEIIETYQN